jgi:hypothetical protein
MAIEPLAAAAILQRREGCAIAVFSAAVIAMARGRLSPIPIGSDDRKAGLMRCKFSEEKVLGGSFVKLEYVDAEPVFEFFRPNEKEKYRLARVGIETWSQAFDRIVAAFRERFGQPTTEHASQVQNAFGAMFQNSRLEWRNGMSSILMQQRTNNIEKMMIAYSHLELSTAAAASLFQVKGKPSDRL